MSIDYGTSVVEPSVRWDLTSMEELDIDAVGIEIEAACRRFGERHRGRIGFLGPEELAGALAAREPGAFEAWLALYEQVAWTIELELEGRSVAIYEALSYLRHPDRRLRRTALYELHRALEQHADVVAHCYDAVVADRLAVDELRGY